MDINLKGFDETSRLWIYQADRRFSDLESKSVQEALDHFTIQWAAHSRQLKAKGLLVENRFIVLAVDESLTGASGCSIDASVHFLQDLQQKLGVDLFDRMRFAFMQNGEIQSTDRASFSTLYSQGKINDDTLVVDTLIKTKKDLPLLLKPLKDSWHIRMI